MTNVSRPHIIEFKKIGDPTLGYISVAENQSLPFDIKRVYWTYFTPHEVTRGNHAHYTLEQILVAVSGQITVSLENLQGEKTTFILNKPHEGLVIPMLYWRTLEFSHNAVMLCMASEEYREEDYIRSYEKFKSLEI